MIKNTGQQLYPEGINDDSMGKNEKRFPINLLHSVSVHYVVISLERLKSALNVKNSVRFIHG